MREIAVLIMVLAGIVLACGCTAQAPAGTTVVNTPSPAPVATIQAASGSTAQVIIRASSFDPNILNIRAGTTVTWKNEDTIAHRVVHLPAVNSPELFHSASLSPGESFSYTFQEAGRYSYGDPQHGGGRSPLVIVS
jgi:plastocyanin